MNFISIEFIIFFCAVFLLYIILTHRLQNRMLLVASYVFYGWWDWRFLSLLIISSVVDYFCGLIVDKSRNPQVHERMRKVAISASVTVNLGILGIFKYYDFFVDPLINLIYANAPSLFLGYSYSPLSIILPVGISFYTFQSMSYSIDIYRGKLQSTKSFLDFMLYVSFFPQLVAGPIERGRHLLPQIINPRTVRLDRFYSGVQLTIWGFLKKMIIADNMAFIANKVFSTASPSGVEVVLAIYAFSIQIYCDFSGYTDIARGISRMMGFEICENFRLPYFAKNPRDFWQRWHISLSAWLKDYLYIPLGGNRKGSFATYRNLFITMLLGGLWHGASWKFVVWGAYHGSLLIIHRLLCFLNFKKGVPPKYDNRFYSLLKVIIFFHLTCIGWFIFRVPSIKQLVQYPCAIVADFSWTPTCFSLTARLLLGSLPLLALQVYQHLKQDMEPWVKWSVGTKVVFYVIIFYLFVFFNAPGTSEFIYFRF